MAHTPAQAVQREIKPNKKHPIAISASGRTFKGSVIIVTGTDPKGKDIVEIVESKTRFIPAQIVAMMMTDLKPEAVKKLEAKLVPLASTGTAGKDTANASK